jgi:hypothetical protein
MQGTGQNEEQGENNASDHAVLVFLTATCSKYHEQAT